MPLDNCFLEFCEETVSRIFINKHSSWGSITLPQLGPLFNWMSGTMVLNGSAGNLYLKTFGKLINCFFNRKLSRDFPGKHIRKMSSLKVVTFTNKNINKYFLIFSWNYKFSLKSKTYNLLWIVPEHGKTLDKKVRAYALSFY